MRSPTRAHAAVSISCSENPARGTGEPSKLSRCANPGVGVGSAVTSSETQPSSAFGEYTSASKTIVPTRAAKSNGRRTRYAFSP